MKDTKKVFKDIPLILYPPSYDDPLTTVIFKLEKLRVNRLGGPVPPDIFFQLKDIFQIVESLGSARIEGNNTTLSEFIENIIDDPSKRTTDEKIQEIYNIEKAISFIDQNVSKKTIINRSLISEVHKILVKNLTPPPNGEGSRYPGQLRPINVSISKSSFTPPDHTRVQDYFEELMTFINKQHPQKYHLLVTALSHHRMAWIHPFDNCNGRLVRMFTYMLLIKQGFQVKTGRILNPTAIFCMDRQKYYNMLSLADTGEKNKIFAWCMYVLKGLLYEIEKIDRLLNYKYLLNDLLIPSLNLALERQHITKKEHEILKAVVQNENMKIKAADLASIVPSKYATQRSRAIKKLKDKQMLKPLKKNGRIYTIGFANNYLLRSVIQTLSKNGFIPKSLDKKNL